MKKLSKVIFPIWEEVHVIIWQLLLYCDLMSVVLFAMLSVTNLRQFLEKPLETGVLINIIWLIFDVIVYGLLSKFYWKEGQTYEKKKMEKNNRRRGNFV